MLLNEPPPTSADIHFRLFDIPIRVHPFFWVVAILLGIRPGADGSRPPEQLLIWIAVMFVSIVVHELGHALLQRRFGGRPWITLHGFGGLASCSDCDRSPRSQILISLAGPGAGFALAALVAAGLAATGHGIGFQLGPKFVIEDTSLLAAQAIGLGIGTIYWSPPSHHILAYLVGALISINILWGLVNLLPIYPLDGGQISRELCTLNRPSRGIVLSLQISIVCAAAMAIVGLLAWGSLWVAIMFGFICYSNYRTLEAYQASRW